VRLRSSNPSLPGFTRRRCGRGFRYLDEDGRPIDDDEVLERLRGLVIPPAWDDVWICLWENGHLQAIGVDAAGRRQYLYHEVWRTERDREKFERMLEFADALPRLRRTVARDLRLRGFPRQRLQACATRLLDRGFFRIGGEEYAEENGTFGLATFRKRHVGLPARGVLVFEYVAKGRKPVVRRIVDREAYDVVARLKRRRGSDQLLAYKNGLGWAPLRSDDVNDYIREHAHGPHTAKDFRTWHATVLAAVSVAVLGERAKTESARRTIAAQATKEVSRYLGNTPAVCRDSYVDPRVFERFYEGRTIRLDLESIGEDIDDADRLLAAESAALELLAAR